jgi:hypothetical protein
MNAPTTFSFDLHDDHAARRRAQEIADRTGREVLVSDHAGEVCRLEPNAAESNNSAAASTSDCRALIGEAVNEMRDTIRRSRAAVRESYEVLARANAIFRP